MQRKLTNWCLETLNLSAFALLIYLLGRENGGGWASGQVFDAGLESGKWAIRYLLLCLSMTPLQIYCGWREATRLRKPAGLWSFAFAVLHVALYIADAGWSWLVWPLSPFLGLGLVGLLILTALAVTSNRRAMVRLRRNWKRLHRLVYGAGVSVICHGILATGASKKMHFSDPDAIHELRLYLALLTLLLLVRLPLVRRLWKGRALPRRGRRDLPTSPLRIPIEPPAYPVFNGGRGRGHRRVRLTPAQMEDCGAETGEARDGEADERAAGQMRILGFPAVTRNDPAVEWTTPARRAADGEQREEPRTTETAQTPLP